MTAQRLKGWRVTGLTYEIQSTSYDGAPHPMVQISIERPILVYPNGDRRRKKVPAHAHVISNHGCSRMGWDDLTEVFREAGAEVIIREREPKE